VSVAPPPPTTRSPVRWGLLEAFGGLFVVYFIAAVAGIFVISTSGYDDFDDAPLWLFALANAPLHLAMLAVSWWATTTRGNGVVDDIGLRMKPRDIGFGIVMGPVCSVALGLLYLPILDAFGGNSDEVDDAARELTERADSAVGVLALVVTVVLLAPVAEEVFFRGLMQRAVQRRAGAAAGIIISGLVFGAIHFQLLQLPVLAALGFILAYMTWKTGRLGPAIFTHMAFNGLTVLSLLTFGEDDGASALHRVGGAWLQHVLR
jgi:uncharacterized protein